jgi:hypothetical protein
MNSHGLKRFTPFSPRAFALLLGLTSPRYALLGQQYRHSDGNCTFVLLGSPPCQGYIPRRASGPATLSAIAIRRVNRGSHAIGPANRKALPIQSLNRPAPRPRPFPAIHAANPNRLQCERHLRYNGSSRLHDHPV